MIYKLLQKLQKKTNLHVKEMLYVRRACCTYIKSQHLSLTFKQSSLLPNEWVIQTFGRLVIESGKISFLMGSKGTSRNLSKNEWDTSKNKGKTTKTLGVLHYSSIPSQRREEVFKDFKIVKQFAQV